jgi:hypothetical protein
LPDLMVTARRWGRQPDKSDPIDALAVARWRRASGPAAAHLDGPSRQVKLVCNHRADLVVELTKLCSRHTVGVRLNRGSDRTVNWALHMIAATQAAQGIGGGATYAEQLLAAGKTRIEALRLLRRRAAELRWPGADRGLVGCRHGW